MNPNKKKVHKYLINASSDINFLKRIIMLNGILEPAPCKLDFFSFICKTIISQQISFKVANKIWHNLTFEKVKNTKFINFFNEEANRKKILESGVSKKKLHFMISVFDGFKSKQINEKKLGSMNSEEFKLVMKKYKGIGDWTCSMIQIFYFRKENIWPKNDLIINKMVDLINLKENKEINFEKRFDPYLTFVCLHLWEIFPKTKLIN